MKKRIPSDKSGSVVGGVVHPFSVRRKSPNVLYLGDQIGENRITAFEYNGGIQLVQFNNRRWWSFHQALRAADWCELDHL